MARPREFDREAVLDQAMRVFWQHGFEATSTALLLEELGIARSSLYSTFGSKDQLYLEAMDCYLADLRRRVIAPLERQGPPIEVLTRFFFDIAARGTRLGEEPLRCCMVVRASLSREQQPTEVQQRIQQTIDELDQAFLDLLRRAASEGTLSTAATEDLEGSAKFLTSTFQSLNLAAMVGRSASDLRELARRALTSLGIDAGPELHLDTPHQESRS